MAYNISALWLHSPRSEHERHSPGCPYVKGEQTQNVPLSVTYATQPALPHSVAGQKIACVSQTASEDYVATSTKHGNIVVWNLRHKMKVYLIEWSLISDIFVLKSVA